jgi:hypothetical protein
MSKIDTMTDADIERMETEIERLRESLSSCIEVLDRMPSLGFDGLAVLENAREAVIHAQPGEKE